MTSASSGALAVALFGVPALLARADAEDLSQDLAALLAAQCEVADVRSRGEGHSLVELLADLKPWFDPTAKGARLRADLAALGVVPVRSALLNERIALPVGDGKHLVTPEGRLLLHCLSRPGDLEGVELREEDLTASARALLEVYRGWTRRRLDDVVGLLGTETSTLRPAAAGLLLTLLLNRNTDAERRLRRPKNARELAVVTAAVSGPSLAYAKGLTGRPPADTALDLYRGWALGELRRRLGPGFHSDLEGGIWLDPESEAPALNRLIAHVERLRPRVRMRVGAALAGAVEEYGRQRPRLAALGLAHERPANTRRLVERLTAAAKGDGHLDDDG